MSKLTDRHHTVLAPSSHKASTLRLVCSTETPFSMAAFAAHLAYRMGHITCSKMVQTERCLPDQSLRQSQAYYCHGKLLYHDTRVAARADLDPTPNPLTEHTELPTFPRLDPIGSKDIVAAKIKGFSVCN